ncbi:Ribosomal RNA-processing protein 7 [Tulasnella sp. 424]|nr:Ribosomal RNA-processing protein 7 [Tulasnella sp. 424]KAG8982047.1 Ribosomal RNA-processing protein 7 [Tulasnella sp. 425]
MGKQSAAAKGLQINGFNVIRVTYPPTTIHYIYVRKHETSQNTPSTLALPQDRTLFVVNLPPDAAIKEVSQLFSAFGEVDDVRFGHATGSTAPSAGPPEEDEEMADEDAEDSDSDSDMEVDGPKKKRRKLSRKQPPKVIPLPTPDVRTLRPTGSTAHVIFKSPDGLQAALKPIDTPLKWPKPRNPPLGLAHYTSKYDSLRPSLDVVKQHADTSLEAYEFIRERKEKAKMGIDDEDEDEGEEKKQKPAAIVDEDGFTLVTRGGPKRGPKVVTKDFAAAIQHGEQNEAAERLKKHQDKIHLKDFYRFQVREKKRSAFMEQRKKFEQDKEAIERLKAKRKFKPY